MRRATDTPVIWRPSANFDTRPDGVTSPSFLIFHFTGTATAEEAAVVYCDSTRSSDVGRISPHYMVGVNGEITAFIEEEKRAWHCGVSFWQGCRDLNGHSIGIELVNKGNIDGYPPFAPDQISALEKLASDIIKRHGISPYRVLGHSDIAPGRKVDPGPAFPWEHFACAGIGVYPAPETKDFVLAHDLLAGGGSSGKSEHDRVFQRLLTAYGYNPDCGTEILKRSFAAHYASGSQGSGGAYKAAAGRGQNSADKSGRDKGKGIKHGNRYEGGDEDLLAAILYLIRSRDGNQAIQAAVAEL